MIGLFDTKDQLWMGNDEGPLLYDDAAVATVAAMIVDRSLKQVLGRTRPLPYSPAAKRKHDEKPILIDPVKALEQLEEGQ